MIMMIFSEITEKQCVKERYIHAKAKIWLKLRHNVKTVRLQDRMCHVYQYYNQQEVAYATLHGHLSNSWALCFWIW